MHATLTLPTQTLQAPKAPPAAPSAAGSPTAGSSGSPGFARLLGDAAQAQQRPQAASAKPPEADEDTTAETRRSVNATSRLAPGRRAGGPQGSAGTPPAPAAAGPTGRAPVPQASTGANDANDANDATGAPAQGAEDARTQAATDPEPRGAPELSALLAEMRAALPVAGTTVPATTQAVATAGPAIADPAEPGSATAAAEAALASAANATGVASVNALAAAASAASSSTSLHGALAPGPKAPNTHPGAGATGASTAPGTPVLDAAGAAGQPFAASIAAELSQAQARTALGGPSAETPSPASSSVLASAGVGVFQAGSSTPIQSGTAPAEARMSASPGSAEFAPQLGAQITTFARHGIEHARLHLNPAEMGPVMVQIQLDGQAAQIHMSADHVATRQALEQAMPALASGLREAGLTLAGGGVFEQPQQAQEQAQGDSARASRRPEAALPGAAAEASASTPVLQRRGLVDLVA